MTLQSSEASATRSGITALQMAFTGVTACRQDVQDTRATLATGYQGQDGAQFGALLDKWDKYAGVILANLTRMDDELNETLRQHGLTQNTAMEQINSQNSASQRVVDELLG